MMSITSRPSQGGYPESPSTSRQHRERQGVVGSDRSYPNDAVFDTAGWAMPEGASANALITFRVMVCARRSHRSSLTGAAHLIPSSHPMLAALNTPEPLDAV